MVAGGWITQKGGGDNLEGTGSMGGLRLLARLEREAVTSAASFTGLLWFLLWGKRWLCRGSQM